jgi:hypothetical protein
MAATSPLRASFCKRHLQRAKSLVYGSSGCVAKLTVFETLMYFRQASSPCPSRFRKVQLGGGRSDSEHKGARGHSIPCRTRCISCKSFRNPSTARSNSLSSSCGSRLGMVLISARHSVPISRPRPRNRNTWLCVGDCGHRCLLRLRPHRARSIDARPLPVRSQPLYGAAWSPRNPGRWGRLWPLSESRPRAQHRPLPRCAEVFGPGSPQRTLSPVRP